jgi:hypothetical protein
LNHAKPYYYPRIDEQIQWINASFLDHFSFEVELPCILALLLIGIALIAAISAFPSEVFELLRGSVPRPVHFLVIHFVKLLLKFRLLDCPLYPQRAFPEWRVVHCLDGLEHV